MTTPRITGGAALLVAWIIGGPIHAEPLESAFVAGFDRFARHAEIEPVTAGRLLLTELNCTACHRSADADLAPSGGPLLDGVGNRLQVDWLREFLASPQRAKPGTRMPDMLAGLEARERTEAIDALVAFLSSQQRPYPEFKASGARPLPHEFWLKGNAERGRELYHQVGCVACHASDSQYQGGEGRPSMMANLLATLDPEEIEDLGLAAAVRPVPSVPHAELSKKYTHRSLMAFLANPEAVRPNGRMPDLKLDLIEATDIAAYLLGGLQPELQATPVAREVASDEALVAKGRQLFTSLSCVNCHAVTEPPPATRSRPLEDLNLDAPRSCLGPATAEMPAYHLDALQVESIATAAAALKESENSEPDATDRGSSRLQLTLLQQNCYACHERGGRGGVGPERQRYFETVAHTDLGDEGRLPPPLDHVGRKLKRDWLAKVFAGAGDLRPHMQARMPRFPAESVKHLPQAFNEVDAPDPASEAEEFSKQEGLVEAGRMLLDTGCVQCHPLRGESLMGAVGVDLQGVTERVQPEWFAAFLRNPAALKNRTRMPSFFHEGKSTNPDILGGDVDVQIGAIWTYLKNLKTARLPDKIEQARSQQFELIPEQRPILIRTFMNVAGPHAIAVGFPEQVHYAFDAETMRLAQAWRGRFLDAYGTWFVRAAPPADPLGEDVVSMPPGFPFAILPDAGAEWPADREGEDARRFLGYRFDTRGVPTVRYRFAGFEVDDRIEATEEGGLRRTLEVRAAGRDMEAKESGPNGELWFRAHAGDALTRNEASCVQAKGVAVSVRLGDSSALLTPDLRDHGDQSEWRIRVRDGERLEVNYQW